MPKLQWTVCLSNQDAVCFLWCRNRTCVCNLHVTFRGFRRLMARHSVSPVLWPHKSPSSTRSIKLPSCGMYLWSWPRRGVYSSSYEVEKIRWDETHSIHHHIRATRGIRVGRGPTSSIRVGPSPSSPDVTQWHNFPCNERLSPSCHTTHSCCLISVAKCSALVASHGCSMPCVFYIHFNIIPHILLCVTYRTSFTSA